MTPRPEAVQITGGWLRCPISVCGDNVRCFPSSRQSGGAWSRVTILGEGAFVHKVEKRDEGNVGASTW